MCSGVRWGPQSPAPAHRTYGLGWNADSMSSLLNRGVPTPADPMIRLARSPCSCRVSSGDSVSDCRSRMICSPISSSDRGTESPSGNSFPICARRWVSTGPNSATDSAGPSG
jgi:hypothetical protein